MPGLKASAGLSISLALSVPLTAGSVFSTTEPLPVEITGASSVPVMVTVTTCEVPSMVVTVKVSSGNRCPAPSACTAGSALFSV